MDENIDALDITKDPFIITGREAFNKSLLLAISKVLQSPKQGRIGFDQFFLSIPSDKFMSGHIEVVKNTFSKFKFCREPKKYVEHGKTDQWQEFLFVTFAENFHKVSDDEKEFIEWDTPRVAEAKQRFVSLLDTALIDFYNASHNELSPC